MMFSVDHKELKKLLWTELNKQPMLFWADAPSEEMDETVDDASKIICFYLHSLSAGQARADLNQTETFPRAVLFHWHLH